MKIRRLSLAAFALGFLALFGGQLFRGEIFYSTDQFAFYFTGHRYFFEAWKQFGSPQWWNPYANLGAGFLANPTWGLFYPLTWVQRWIPVEFAFQMLWVFHWGLLSWGLVRWGRTSGADARVRWILPPLAATSAIFGVFTLAGVGYLYASVWCVWILSELELARSHKMSRLRLFLFWALLISTGEVTAVFLFGWVMLAHLRKWDLVTFAAVSIVAALPTYGHAALTLPYTTRAAGLSPDQNLGWSVHPLRMLTWMAPYFYGHPTQGTFNPQSVVNSSPFNPRFLFDTIYLSFPALILMALGAIRAWRRKQWLWIGLCAFGLLMAFGKWGVLAALGEIPPFKFLRYPEKMILYATPLLLGLALKFTGELKDWFKDPLEQKLGLALAAGSVVLPLFSPRPEWGVAVLSAIIVGAFVIFRQRKITEMAFLGVALVAGVAQNVLAFPPQRLVPLSSLGQWDPWVQEIEKRLPESSFQRFDVAPEIQKSDYPHRHFEFGINMLRRRASVYGYDSIHNRLMDEANALLFGMRPDQIGLHVASPVDPRALNAAIQVTNLKYFVVLDDQPFSHLFKAVETDAGVFRLGGTVNGRIFLETVQKTSAIWYFPKLDELNESSVQLMHWPPRVSSRRVFMKGLERRGTAQLSACADPKVSAVMLDEAMVISKKSEDRLTLDLEAPCDGWIFLSQNLVPGWSLTLEDGKDSPLVLVNGALVGIPVKKGRLRGELKFEPWKALGSWIMNRP